MDVATANVLAAALLRANGALDSLDGTGVAETAARVARWDVLLNLAAALLHTHGNLTTREDLGRRVTTTRVEHHPVNAHHELRTWLTNATA